MRADESPDLELALLRRGVLLRDAERERCVDCGRTPLIGERVYAYDEGVVRCELCRALNGASPAGWSVVHGPEFGHTMKLADRRRRVAGPGVRGHT